MGYYITTQFWHANIVNYLVPIKSNSFSYKLLPFAKKFFLALSTVDICIF